MNLKFLLSFVFCVSIVYHLHGQILPAYQGVFAKRVFSNGGAIVSSGLVLHLDAGNASSYSGSGTTWTDLSGTNNHGTLENGPTYSSSNGGSIVFDGVNDRVSAFPTQISGTGSKTISLWIKINTTSRTGLAGIRSTANWGWGFTVNRTTIGNLTFYDTNGSHLEVAAGLTTSIWYNVSVTYNSANRIATLYLNGYQIGSLANFNSLNASTFKGVIGHEEEGTGGSFFKGNIAQVAIYSRDLTPAEVLENYYALRPRFGDVTNPATGKTWMDRNLGATRVATSSTDHLAYGSLYQWGRGSDGHELINWSNATTGVSVNTTTSTTSSSNTPGNVNFIISSGNYDWLSTQNNNLWQGVNGINNPCPSGYRLPTKIEWEAELASWGSRGAADAFASPLKLTMAGFRDAGNGVINAVGSYGAYWTSTIYLNNSHSFEFNAVGTSAHIDNNPRAFGMSVRCIKD